MIWNLPNTLTWLRIFAIPLVVMLYSLPYHWSDPAAGLLFAAAGITDSLDGYFARKYRQTSKLGAFLDPVADKLIVAVALAEHLAIQYGDRGICVSVLCPQSVQTGMTTPGPSAARVDGVLQPPEVARMVIEAMEAERFLILSHPQVAEYMQRKVSNRDRWLNED